MFFSDSYGLSLKAYRTGNRIPSIHVDSETDVKNKAATKGTSGRARTPQKNIYRCRNWIVGSSTISKVQLPARDAHSHGRARQDSGPTLHIAKRTTRSCSGFGGVATKCPTSGASWVWAGMVGSLVGTASMAGRNLLFVVQIQRHGVACQRGRLSTAARFLRRTDKMSYRHNTQR